MKKRNEGRKGHFAVIFISIVALTVMAYFYFTMPKFNVKEFIVEGNQYYTADEVVILGRCKTGLNIIFETKTSKIKEVLESDPYIVSADVSRRLPDKILIKIKEVIQSAALPCDGKYAVVDGNGMVIKRTDFLPRVTLLENLTIISAVEGEALKVKENLLLRQCLQLSGVAGANDMFFKSVKVSEGNFECTIVDGLVCIGTPEDIVKAIASGHLQPVVRKLFEENKYTGRITVSGGDTISYSPESGVPTGGGESQDGEATAEGEDGQGEEITAEGEDGQGEEIIAEGEDEQGEEIIAEGGDEQGEEITAEEEVTQEDEIPVEDEIAQEDEITAEGEAEQGE